MRRYLLFGGADYYPLGGWNDFVGSYNTYEEAYEHKKLGRSQGYEWTHIVDTNIGEMVQNPPENQDNEFDR